MPFRFEVYDFAHYAAEQHDKMNAMEASGWTIHTVSMAFTEVSVLWERGGKAGRKDKAEDTATLAPGFAGGSGLVPDPDSGTGVTPMAEIAERQDEERAEREREQEKSSGRGKSK